MNRIFLLAAGVVCAASLGFAQLLQNQAAETQNQQRQRQSSRSNTNLTAPSGQGFSTTENPFLNAVPSGQATSEEIALTLPDAIRRGLRQNLGAITSCRTVESARTERLRALNALLPNLSSNISETSQQVNLAAFGFSGLPGVPTIVGPFEVFDARAYLSQSLFDWNAIQNRRSAGHNVKAADFANRDARETVVLAIVNLYLQAISAAALADEQRAELETARALLKQAQDARAAGVVAGIDVLRAQVEAQAQEQRLIAQQNDADKQKLNVARAVGLPPGQAFRLVDRLPYTPAQKVPLQDALQQALSARADYQSAQARVRASELAVKAARAERYPTGNLDASYGAIGPSLTNSHGTYSVAAGVRIPIFQGTRVEADVQEAATQLALREAERDSLRGQIDAEIRSAFLDVDAAGRAVEVARSNVDLARQTLVQARDRFAAGVTNNIEVIQAQEAVAAANQNLVTSLYRFNYAKAALIRAVGGTEDAISQALQSR